MARLSALFPPLLLFTAARASLPAALESALAEVAKEVSQKYNCSVSIAFRNADGVATAAAGIVDFSTGQQAQPSDTYAWGSVTKMYTAASIMKLVSEGAFGLDDHVAPLVNPLLRKMAAANPQQNFSCLEDLWGQNISGTTIRQLLSMQDGVPDFDTANPSKDGHPVDPLRTKLYDSPDHDFTPLELMSVPWVAHQWDNRCRHVRMLPMSGFCYSSTNFMLLGLVLAAHAPNASSWTDLDQSVFMPSELREHVRFALKGAPKDYGAAHGYDRTAYNMPRGVKNDHDNVGVDGVFAGWTASNILGTPAAIANLTWEIFGPPSSVAPKQFADLMIPHHIQFYGLGTFNLNWLTGRRDKFGTGYGHLGATYGYQSASGYFPGLNATMSIATNIETDTQDQPFDAFCRAYNTAVALHLGEADLKCVFTSHGFYGGMCKCSPRSAELIV